MPPVQRPAIQEALQSGHCSFSGLCQACEQPTALLDAIKSVSICSASMFAEHLACLPLMYSATQQGSNKAGLERCLAWSCANVVCSFSWLSTTQRSWVQHVLWNDQWRMCMSVNTQDVVHKLSELLASYSQVLHDNASSTASGSASTAASSLAHSSASTAAAASDSASRLGAQQPAATEHADRLQPQQGRLQAFVHGFQRDESDLSGDGYSGVGLLHHVPTVLQPMILSSLLPSLSGHHTFSEGVFLDCASWFIQTAENICSGNIPDEPSAALLYITPYLDMMRKSCSALFGNQRGRPLLLPSPNTYTASQFQHVAGHVSVSIVFVLHMPPVYAHGYYTCHACFACKGKFQSCCTVTRLSVACGLNCLLPSKLEQLHIMLCFL